MDARTAQRLPTHSRSITREWRKEMRIRATYLLCALMLCLIAGSAMAQEPVFPDVSMSFNPATSTYTYTVQLLQGNSYPFGQLLLFTHATSWNGSEETWTLGGAIVGGVDQNWLSQFSEGDYGDTVEWRADGGQEALSEGWSGSFTIIAPDTWPTPGQGMTKDGGLESYHYFDTMVPGPVVPEPSSLLALSGLIGLAVPTIRRRRN